jgi:hypothetical protein
MLSQRIFTEIAQVTQEVLKRIPEHGVIDRVTIIRGYVQLLAMHPTRKEYERKLATALLDLSYIASRSKEAELTRDLQALVTAIDAESIS